MNYLTGKHATIWINTDLNLKFAVLNAEYSPYFGECEMVSGYSYNINTKLVIFSNKFLVI